ncbi:rRNA maturation RNase YbeY [Aquimarina sp. U1-2]|uniref:rRNA maturation RNase YbeY n=1 Tax=Aquimarina sp. U1-2 TaxID=2823141 RepID=UPI001AECA4D1|nr:rRNA maturation RNase YbeY [Aquimarina sp. U1-2]MBP2833834.1 rRNA maturation RNase YbeY [Aquimarina sp. U1-2]
MINFFFETDINLLDKDRVSNWITGVIHSEDKTAGEINYIFCDDEYLLKLNQEFLDHNTYTDVIGFDNTIGNELHGDIFISYERIKENAVQFKVDVNEELRRVMVHGILHFCGYKDKSAKDKVVMTNKENEKLQMFHVEHL